MIDVADRRDAWVGFETSDLKRITNEPTVGKAEKQNLQRERIGILTSVQGEVEKKGLTAPALLDRRCFNT